MKKKQFLSIVLVLSIALFTAAIALTQDEEPDPAIPEQPGEGIDAESTLIDTPSAQNEDESKLIESPEAALAAIDDTITYQGQLTDNGNPASGDYEFSFALFDDLAAGIQVGSTVTQVLTVADGLFTATPSFGAVFDGTALYLEIGVRPDGSADPFTTLTPRQALTAAPYALSLRPGADIMGSTTNDASISAYNTATFGSQSYGLRGETDSNSSSVAGVYGRVTSTSPGGYSAGVRGVNNGTGGNGIGVWGAQAGSGWGLYGTSVTGYAAYLTASSAGGRGLYVRGGSNADADIILGGSSTGDDGRITSDPSYSGSDIYLTSNDAVVVQLDADASGEDADFFVQDMDNNTIFNLDESGQLSLYEPGIGEMIEMVTTELGTDGAQLTLRNNAGQATIVLDAEYNAGGDGRITTEVLQITGGSDLSEQFDIQASPNKIMPQAGYVVSIDADNPGELAVSNRAYDRTVAGVISGAGDVQPGMLMGQQGTDADGQFPVALTGRVYVWVDAAYGAVAPGDLLTTSNTAGHAMKVTDYDQAQGTILGKAMTSLESGRGLVLVLVTLQ